MSSGATPLKMNDVYELKILKITLKNVLTFLRIIIQMCTHIFNV